MNAPEQEPTRAAKLAVARQRVHLDACGLVAFWRCAVADGYTQEIQPERLRERLRALEESYAAYELARDGGRR